VSQRQKLLKDEETFKTLQLRDKTIAMADMFHFYMRKDWGCDAYRVVDI
jgi:hypothetical protein